MEANLVAVILYRSLIFGGIPVAFLFVSAVGAVRRYRVLLPSIVALALYQGTCFLVLWQTYGTSPEIPEVSDLRLLCLALPIVVAFGGSMWSFVSTKVPRERVIGTVISTVGSGLTASQAYIYIMISWGTI